jgi:hypothetical protein
MHTFFKLGSAELNTSNPNRTILYGMGLAIVFGVIQIVLVVKYVFNTIQMVKANDGVRRRLSILPNDRLKERMRFIGKRFADHAPYWQVSASSTELAPPSATLTDVGLPRLGSLLCGAVSSCSS